jgi:hypothetical protein
VARWVVEVVDVRVEDRSTIEVIRVGLSVVKQHLVEDEFGVEVVGVEDGCIVEVDAKWLPVEDGAPAADVHLNALLARHATPVNHRSYV